MKTIGLIGGMSWESSAHYYRLLNRRAAELLGGLHSAPILMHSVDFAPVEELQRAGDWAEAGRQLREIAAGLEGAGAGLVGIASNTMHVVAEAVAARLTVPFIHIADPTAEALIADGVNSVGLIGTRFTMQMPFYRERLEGRGLTVLTPETGQTNLDGIIYHELCLGIVREKSRRTYIETIEALESRGAEAVILGCTELMMLVDDSVSPLPTYDTTELHARALIEVAMRDQTDA